MQCLCHPDWFGPNCDYDILTAGVFLPWPDADGGSWGPPAQWEAAAAFVHGDEGNCSLALERARHHELLPGPRGAGAGLVRSRGSHSRPALPLPVSFPLLTLLTLLPTHPPSLPTFRTQPPLRQASSLIYMLGDHTAALLAGAPYVFTGKINYAENSYCDVRMHMHMHA